MSANTFAIGFAAFSLAANVIALIWARRAIRSANRIRKATESGDRLEMERIARDAVRRATKPTGAPAW